MADVTDPVAEVVAAVWRIESARLTAALTRRTGDLALAEDLAADVFSIALQQWPRDGVPERPGAWLMATAHHRLVDHARRRTVGQHKHLLYAAGSTDAYDPAEEALDMIDSPLRDDDLRLLFMSCHPALPREGQVLLTLKVVGGLQTGEIARAFLITESTAAQRIVRAKKRLKQSGARFELPADAEIADRLATVLAVVYAIFNEGYAATAGDHWTRPELCQDALRLGRRLVALRPAVAEVHGLLALMELQASRLPARQTPTGRPVLLDQQDRRRWDRLLIRRGLAGLQRAGDLGGGLYTLQAEIAACHARAESVAGTDWRRIAALYAVLSHLAPSPVIKLNHAAAVVRADGPDAGLQRLDALAGTGGLDDYPLFHVTRGDALEQLARYAEAADAFGTAVGLEPHPALRALYAERAATATAQAPAQRGIRPATSVRPAGPDGAGN
jgi:RNA polymerase sigma factor (sigma-70 family)